jgi:hypothetical protein
VLKVQARATGRQSPLVPDRELPTDGWGAQTLRQLIERVVREDAMALDQIVSAGLAADPDVSVALALQAFEDRLYLVLIDGRQQRKLDAPAPVGPDSTLTFLRLVAFAGG